MTLAEDGEGRGTRTVLAGLIAALVLAGMLHAREAGAAEDDTELAKKTQNPVADLISVHNAERPKNASDWQLRFQVQFLLPTFQ